MNLLSGVKSVGITLSKHQVVAAKAKELFMFGN